MNWLHVLAQLTWGYQHIHCLHHLMHYYMHHHAIGFLRSGYTSESPTSNHAARVLLRILTFKLKAAPVDW